MKSQFFVLLGYSRFKACNCFTKQRRNIHTFHRHLKFMSAYLLKIKQLTRQCQQAIGVLRNHRQILLNLRVGNFHLLQRLQRTIDQSKRSTHFVGNLRKEIDLRLIQLFFFLYLEQFLTLFHFLFLPVFIPEEPGYHHADKPDKIEYVCPRGEPPGR